MKGWKWQFGTAVTVALISVLVAVISLAGLLLTNWDKVQIFIHSHSSEQLPSGKRRGHVHTVKAPEEEGQTWR